MNKEGAKMDVLNGLNWSDLRVLLVLRAYGGATSAARALGLSHQTVSRRITALERALGLRLVNRERHPWTLTEKGKVICDHADRMSAVVDEMAQFARREHPDVIDRVSIACNTWGFDLLVLPALAAVRRRFPALSFDLISGDDPVDVQSGKADIALRFTDAPPEDLLGRQVGALSVGVFGHPDQIAALDHGEYDALSLIRMRAQRHGQIWPVDPDRFQSVVVVDDFSTLACAVDNGIGVAALPRVVGDRLRGAVPSQKTPLSAGRSVWLLRNQDSRGAKVIAAVAAAIHDHASKILNAG
ncbi:LysR family transcriptional regulator [Rhodovulum sp. FJ3]|uniref:LysR family transcriptional regulator n=1 Tax=Rhodovulum sp. FJ3 TaxID=3079053 RepID=UPI00293DFFCE|nr:LysR family transcriptional regulator [Rhodovulum sp. FJ3]MDV4168234.1 LysR family transcriptional regulator [Rhodovulum sp. FJ3]